MKTINKENLSYFLRIMLEITFVLGIVFMLFFKTYVDHYYFWYFGGNGVHYFFTLAAIYSAGIFGLAIVRQIISILQTVTKKTPFIYKNVSSLKTVSILCFLISFVFLVYSILYVTVFSVMITLSFLLSVIIAIAFLLIGFCALIFSSLFKEAIIYKTENELTI